MEIVVGLASIALGAMLCLRGLGAARLLMSVWGGFIGFLVGYGITTAVLSDGGVATVAAIIVGAVFGFLGAWLTRAYWVVAVVVTIGSFGFIAATAIMGAIGMRWNWIVVTLGVAAGIALAAFSARADVPARLLMVIMSLIGAAAIVFGLLLLFDRFDFSRMTGSLTENIVREEPWWIAVYLGLALAGMIAQGAFTSRGNQVAREVWSDARVPAGTGR